MVVSRYTFVRRAESFPSGGFTMNRIGVLCCAAVNILIWAEERMKTIICFISNNIWVRKEMLNFDNYYHKIRKQIS